MRSVQIFYYTNENNEGQRGAMLYHRSHSVELRLSSGQLGCGICVHSQHAILCVPEHSELASAACPAPAPSLDRAACFLRVSFISVQGYSCLPAAQDPNLGLILDPSPAVTSHVWSLCNHGFTSSTDPHPAIATLPSWPGLGCWHCWPGLRQKTLPIWLPCFLPCPPTPDYSEHSSSQWAF